MAQKISAESAKAIENKNLADASVRAKTAIDALDADLSAANQLVATRTEAAKTAVLAVATAQAALVKERDDAAKSPKMIEGLESAVAAATNALAPKKIAVDEAAKAVTAAKAKADQLNIEYQKRSQEAGLVPTTQPQGARANAS